MVFSTKLSKFGKGDNISLYMESPKKLYIYYFKGGVLKKELTISDSDMSLNSTTENLPYNEVIQIENFLITRIEKSLGIILNE